MTGRAAEPVVRRVGDHVGIVGGGMLGLTLALRLAQAGRRVCVLEAAPEIGGLAAAWALEGPDGPVVWDRHYHVTLLSDRRVRALLRELGLEEQVQWVQTRTGYFSEGQLTSVSDAVDFARLPGLSLIAKARLATTILHGARVRDWRRLEQVPVATWLTRWSGRATFERFWRPLLEAKLGASWREANAAFIWATIQRLYAARRTGLKREMFGYVPGGYAQVLERFGRVLAAHGVEVVTNATVERVERRGAELVTVLADSRTLAFDDVVVTANPDVAARICTDLDDASRSRLEAIAYQGIVCASVLLRRRLSPYYLTYLLDDLPFTAVVDMSAFVDPRHLGGLGLVYLPKYVAPDDPMFETGDDELAARFLPALRRVHPDLDDGDVLTFRVSRVRRVFPIPTLGYSQRVPPLSTAVPGLHLASSAQIVNGTLNVEETVTLAERAGRALLAGDGALPAR